jgi:hypothetical protein
VTAAYRGSCLCGGVRYAIDGELGDFGYCHCTSCRKASGSAHAANAPIERAQLTIVAGGEMIGSLDTAFTRQPVAHTFVGDKAPWEPITDDLPKFDTWASRDVLDQRGARQPR